MQLVIASADSRHLQMPLVAAELCWLEIACLAEDSSLSFWMVIEASDTGVGISLEDRAPIQVAAWEWGGGFEIFTVLLHAAFLKQVWREGTSSIHLSGLYHNVQQVTRLHAHKL